MAAFIVLLGAASAQALTQPLDAFEQPTGVASNPWGPEYLPEPKATFVGITAQRRRVERGKAAVLTIWVSPCVDRKGESVALLRDGRTNGTKFLSRACTAHFLRRIHRGTTFAAVTHEERGYLPGESRPLKIRIAPTGDAERPSGALTPRSRAIEIAASSAEAARRSAPRRRAMTASA